MFLLQKDCTYKSCDVTSNFKDNKDEKMGIKNKIIQALARNAPYVDVLPIPVIAQRAPTSSDNLPSGALWVDQSVMPYAIYTSLGNGQFSQSVGSSSLLSPPPIGSTTPNTGDFTTLTADLLQIKGGAVTDFVGTGVLTAGTQTIANTNIATGDIILLTRIAVNASTSLGALTYTISNGASFTVTSATLSTPGSTETGDASSYDYFIVRPT